MEGLDNYPEMTQLSDRDEECYHVVRRGNQRPMSFLEKAHSVEDQGPAAAKPWSLREAGVLRCTFANEYSEIMQ